MKKIILYILITFCLLGAGIISYASYDYKPKIESSVALSNSVFMGVKGLNKTIVSYGSSSDLSNYTVTSMCNTKSNYLGKSQNYYFFQINYLDESCKNLNIVLEGEGLKFPSTLQKMNIFNKYSIYNKFIDYNSADLEDLIYELEKRKILLEGYKDLSEHTEVKFKYFIKQRKYNEVSYILSILKLIINSREEDYIVPVRGYSLPVLDALLPNYSRAYRSEYTDGVHHGWDVYAPNNTTVRSIDSGIIVKVVNNFSYSDISKINKSSNISYEQELKNLDILRGNQVWLKTMKGDVIFYAHLSEVFSDIKEGMIVKKGTLLGKTGVSGVPQIGYDNYHLHFAIHKNPYNKLKVGKYTNMDYMKWDWYFKGEEVNVVKLKQYTIFSD